MLLVGRFGEHIIGRDAYYHYVKQAPVMLDMFRWGTLELSMNFDNAHMRIEHLNMIW